MDINATQVPCSEAGCNQYLPAPKLCTNGGRNHNCFFTAVLFRKVPSSPVQILGTWRRPRFPPSPKYCGACCPNDLKPAYRSSEHVKNCVCTLLSLAQSLVLCRIHNVLSTIVRTALLELSRSATREALEPPRRMNTPPTARVDWPRPRVDKNLDVFTAGIDELARDIGAPFRHLEAATRRQSVSEQQRAAWLAALTPLPASPTASQEVRDRDLAQRIALGYSPSPSPPPTSSQARALVASNWSHSPGAVGNSKRRRSPSLVDPLHERRVRQKSTHLRSEDSDDDDVEIVGERCVIKIEARIPSRPAPVVSGSCIVPVASGSRIPPVASGSRIAPIIITGSPRATPSPFPSASSSR
ncbi:hypothetical protein K438DRAFT_2033390 [Mycena galopus ATCC 62051]|nr:hypothetical protein K438DRAFT_2033390 [Mycena galopus ATCC 62051]